MSRDTLINGEDDFIDRESKSNVNEENLLGLIQTKNIENNQYEFLYDFNIKDIILILMIFFISFHFINYYTIIYFIYGIIYFFLIVNKNIYSIDKKILNEILLIIISLSLIVLKIFFRIFFHKLKNNFFIEILYDMIILIFNLIFFIINKKDLLYIKNLNKRIISILIITIFCFIIFDLFIKLPFRDLLLLIFIEFFLAILFFKKKIIDRFINISLNIIIIIISITYIFYFNNIVLKKSKNNNNNNTFSYITLNNGIKMPQIGYGVYEIKNDTTTEECVLNALKTGYRLIDTAHIYRNERMVGSAIKKSEIPREEIFVTSKLWVTDFGSERTGKAIDLMLKRLGLEYIDLLLIHFPFGRYMEAWFEMEKAYKEGKLKSIGISNFENGKLKNFYENENVTIIPVINQVELHPYFQQRDVREILKEHNTQIEGWAPLGHNLTNIFNEDIIIKLSKKYKKTPAQIVLRWHIQSGFVVIPKTTHKERMEENINIFDFNLTENDMKEINDLNLKEKRIQVSDEELEKSFEEALEEEMFD